MDETGLPMPYGMEINGNLRILNEITGKLVTLNIKI
jgi:hypothetical protein